MKRHLMIALLAMLGAGAALADGEESEGAYGGGPVNAPYEKECSACHIAYPAGMLPAESWDRIMATLDDHFGENARLDPATQAEITAYLTGAASRRAAADPADPPLRITELPWFVDEHGGRMAARAKSDPKIGSMSNCAACHADAARGMFDD